MNESQTERSRTLLRVPGGPSGSARARSNGRLRFCPAIPSVDAGEQQPTRSSEVEHRFLSFSLYAMCIVFFTANDKYSL